MYSHYDLLDFTILAQAVFSFGFFLSLFSVSSNDYVGFVALLLAILFSVFTGLIHYVINKPNRMLYGAILGASVVMIFISLESAVFWGSYGTCVRSSISSYSPLIHIVAPSLLPTLIPYQDPLIILSLTNRRLFTYEEPNRNLQSHLHLFFKMTEADTHRSLYGVECHGVSGMKSCCAFSVFLMLSYSILTILLIRFKDELLGSAPTAQQVRSMINSVCCILVVIIIKILHWQIYVSLILLLIIMNSYNYRNDYYHHHYCYLQ